MPFHKILKNGITSPCHFLTSPLSHSGLKPWKCLLWLFLFRIVSAWKSPCFANSFSWSGRTIWDFWQDRGAKSSSVLALILTLIQFPAAFSYQFMPSMVFSPAHPWLLPQWLYLAVQVSQASLSVHLQSSLRKSSVRGCYLLQGHVYINLHRPHLLLTPPSPPSLQPPLSLGSLNPGNFSSCPSRGWANRLGFWACV